MQLHQLMPFLLHEFKSEHDLLQAIAELSQNFTQKRERLSDYLQDKRLTSAYTAFYLATNIPKLRAAFDWLPPAWLTRLKDSTFIDMGAGPGTFSLAFREWAGPGAKIMQIETSNVMREQAQRLWAGLYPGEKLMQTSVGEKVLFFGHSANEMGPEVTLKYIRELNPEHILFVEPGTKDFFPQMLKIRAELIQQHFHVLFPCPKADSCPLQDSASDWCHQFIQVKQSDDVERLSQMARKDRRHLPLIVHAFSKTFQTPSPDSRLVRVFPETKFSYEWEVCELNRIEHYQIMKRGLSKNSQKVLGEVLAGAALEVMTEKVLPDARRVKVLRLNNHTLEP